MGNEQYDKAIDDCIEAILLDPENKSIKRMSERMLGEMRKQNEGPKKRMLERMLEVMRKQ